MFVFVILSNSISFYGNFRNPMRFIVYIIVYVIVIVMFFIEKIGYLIHHTLFFSVRPPKFHKLH